MSVVEFWNVGTTNSAVLHMNHGDISDHLLHDWLPSFSGSLSAQLMGWPSQLTELITKGADDYMALKSQLGRTERQWKGFVSWMIGVAGTRHVLKQEGYTWIAPLSAFYPNSVKDLDLSKWNGAYPKGELQATRPAKPKSRFMPDYVALKQTDNGLEWALVESKGTDLSLAGIHKCPLIWQQQVENAVLTYRKSPIAVSRHLVVATRSNPGAVQPFTRRLQVRAWNHQAAAPLGLLDLAALEVVSAHLYGLASNLGLRENAEALAIATHLRREDALDRDHALERLDILNKRADSELVSKLTGVTQDHDRWSDGSFSLQTFAGTISISVQSATLTILQALRTKRDHEVLVSTAGVLNAELISWARSARLRHTDQRHVGWNPIGVEVKFEPR